ncbi:MAG: hemerythrin domain-containing protein [Prevotella sp.]|nr:hemerythrin domain-containing protein [Prevotella sp.]
MNKTSRLAFEQWPLDLLIDYALKVHHRTIRKEGPETLQLLDRLANRYSSMKPVYEAFAETLEAIENHLMKEENVLFPYLYELFEAHETKQSLPPMHCGTIANPIGVMMMEHDDETERQNRIAALTNNYTAAPDSDDDCRRVMERLKEFREALLEHIYIENNILFTRFRNIEAQVVEEM